eukprot:221658-Prorocentrum_minimum.AAC.1
MKDHREHLGNIWGTFGEHSREPSMEHSENMKDISAPAPYSPPRAPAPTPPRPRYPPGNLQCGGEDTQGPSWLSPPRLRTLREHLGNV